MPKAEQSAAGKIVNFFKTADLGAAEIVLGLAKDAVLERKRALAVVPTVAAAAPAKKAKAASSKKRSHHKQKTNAAPQPVEESLPLDAPAEAGDAPAPA